MNLVASIFLVVNGILMFSLPRRWAAVPVILAACYLTPSQEILVGPFHFTVLRITILLGYIRAIVRGERLAGGFTGIDVLILLWGLWLMFSSFFHNPFDAAVVFRSGIAYNTLGFYFLIRIFFHSSADLSHLVRIVALVLFPIAIEMLDEKITGANFFSMFGGVPYDVMVRDGRLRAQGPFGHPILAGTVGAVCFPLIVGVWRENRLLSVIGLFSCLAMVYASTSSGPIMTLGFGIFGLLIWRFRARIRVIQVIGVLVYIAVEIVSSRPAYYAILNRIDLTGSSTGWFRAELISQSIKHMGEWWFAGTDYTRHWMPTGVMWSPDHTDITNQYIQYGVWGGLPQVILFVLMIFLAFKYLANARKSAADNSPTTEFMLWAIGCTIFAQMATCVTVAFFDQSYLFIYLMFAAVTSIHAAGRQDKKDVILNSNISSSVF